MTAAAPLLRLLLIVTAMVLATFALGWIGVMLVAVGLAIIDRRASVPAESALAAGAAWAALLIVRVMALSRVTGRAPLAATIAEAMGLPVLLPPLVTIVFPVLLAWSAATVAVGLLHLAGRPRLARASAAAER